LHYTFKIGASIVGNIVREVCIAIWEELAHIEMPSLTEELWKNKAKMFEQRSNFPHCLGAVDGKHFRIINPTETESQHFNYKHFFSIVLLAVVDADYKFSYIDVGSFGKASDSTIFKNSTLWNLLTRNELNIPEACEISNTNVVANYIFIGDEALGSF